MLYREQIPDPRAKIDRLADDIYKKLFAEEIDPTVRATPKWRAIQDGLATVLKQSLDEIRSALEAHATDARPLGKPIGEYSSALKEAALAVADTAARIDMPRLPDKR